MREGEIDGKVYPYPHCDSLVLHAPGKCRYCDAYPARQQARIDLGYNFSDENDPDKTQDPATYLRPAATINRWPGNRARPAGPEIVE